MADLALFVKNQFKLAATTLTDVRTCPAGRSETVTIYLCNQGAATTFRMSIAKNGAADETKQYIYYGSALPANDTLKESFTLTEGDVIRVYAASADVSVNVFVDGSSILAT